MTSMNCVGAIVAVFVVGTAASAGAAEWRGTVGDWELRADRFEDGAPYCYAGADRGPGDRLTFLRSDVGLAVILTRRGWDLAGRTAEVEVAVDDHWHDRRRAALDPTTLMLTWAEPAAARAALARGLELRVTGHSTGRGVRWRLDGGAAALAAIERCWRARRAAFEDDRAVDRDPFHADPAPRRPSPDTPADRAALAAAFEAWLELAAADFRARVTPVTGEPGRYRLETLLGDGEIRLLGGATHQTVLARGISEFRGACPGTAAMADHGRHDLAGVVLLRTRLACGSGDDRRLEAVIVSWPDEPGGLLVVVPDPDGRGLAADFTAALVEDVAGSEGLRLDLRPAELPS